MDLAYGPNVFRDVEIISVAVSRPAFDESGAGPFVERTITFRTPAPACQFCAKPLPEGFFLPGHAPRGWVCHAWTCRHAPTYTCPDCVKKDAERRACPVCGREEEYT